MELQENEEDKEKKAYMRADSKEYRDERCLLTLDLDQ